MGKKVSGFDLSGVEMPGIVGMYGQAIDEEITREGTIKEFIVEVEMSTQLPAKIDSGIVPTGNQLLILRDPLAEEEGGILLIDKSKERGSTAKVLQAGPRCENVSTGDNVVYFSACVRWVDLDADKELRELTMESYDLPRERLKDLALISEADVVMIYD